MAASPKTASPDVNADLAALVARLQAEQAALLLQLQEAKASKAAKVTVKVSPLGAISVRGLPGTNGKFGMTFYRSAWEAMMSADFQKSMAAFLAANAAALSTGKDDHRFDAVRAARLAESAGE